MHWQKNMHNLMQEDMQENMQEFDKYAEQHARK
jgi:hypothetical protein